MFDWLVSYTQSGRGDSSAAQPLQHCSRQQDSSPGGLAGRQDTIRTERPGNERFLPGLQPDGQSTASAEDLLCLALPFTFWSIALPVSFGCTRATIILECTYVSLPQLSLKEFEKRNEFNRNVSNCPADIFIDFQHFMFNKYNGD